jgi:hypothetical protein
MMHLILCHSERNEESLINRSTTVIPDEPEMFRFAQHDTQIAVRFFS